jgi:uncharacterized protein YlxP (DUF503 family)
MRIDFRLHGCRSLKEKRQRLKGIRERFGRAHNVAVSESGHSDTLQRAEYVFVAVAASPDVVERTLMDIELTVQTTVDAELIAVHREWLD